MRRAAGSAALALATSLLLAACGGGSGSSTSDGPASADAAVDPAATLRYGATINLSSFDPHKAALSQDNPPLFLVYDRLVHVDAAGEAVPGLATAWKYSADGMSLTLTLREGVTFTDGTAFDAAAARANLLRIRDLPTSATKADLTAVKDVVVDNPTQVTLQLATRSPQLVRVLSDRTGAMVSPAAFDKPDLDRNPVGTGMYRVTAYTPNNRITYVRNDMHWDAGAAKLAGIDYRILPDAQTRLNALRSGQLDWTIVSPLDFDSLKSNQQFKTEVFESLAYKNLPMNRSRKGLSDLKVREALNLAIDRDALSKVLTNGLAKPCNPAFPPGYFAHNEKVGCGTYAYDPEKAKQLLKEAGFENSLTVELLATPNSAKNMEAVQAQFKNVGVTATIRTDQSAGSLWNVKNEGDILDGTWGGRASPFTTIYQQYMPEGVSNTGNHTDPKVTAAYEAALAATTEEEQGKLLQAAAAAAVENHLDIYLWFDPVPNVWTPKVQGAEAYLGGKQEFRGVGITK